MYEEKDIRWESASFFPSLARLDGTEAQILTDLNRDFKGIMVRCITWTWDVMQVSA